MNEEITPEKFKKVHQGRNVKRFREMQGIKQDSLAEETGYSQQTISRIESQEVLEDDALEKIAKALHVSVDALKKCDDDIAVNIISNTFNEQSIAYQYNFNPIDKIITLYERLLEAKQDQVALLEKLLKEHS